MWTLPGCIIPAAAAETFHLKADRELWRMKKIFL
jgi:hypothetical protein